MQIADIAALKQSPYLAEVRAHELCRLWDCADRVRHEPGKTLYAEGDPANGFYVLLDGALEISASGHRVAVIHPSTVVGDAEVFATATRPATRPVSVKVHGDAPAELLYIPTERLIELIQETPALARAVGGALGGQTLNVVAEVVHVEDECQSPVPLSALADLLAQAVAETGRGLAVLVLRVVDAGPVEREPGPWNINRESVTASTLANTIQQRRNQYDYVFVDAQRVRDRGGIDAARELIDTRFIFCDVETDADMPPSFDAAGKKVIRARLVPPARRSRFASAASLAWLPFQLLAGGQRSFTPVPIELGATERRDCLRAHVDPGYLAGLWDKQHGTIALPELKYLEPDPPHGIPTASEVMACWARKLMGCQIWLALGGGGVLGFAHVELIRRMMEKKLPIDGIAGTSFGAVVGAFYGAAPMMDARSAEEGLPLGLWQLLHAGFPLQLGIAGAMVNSAALGRTIDALLGGVCLDDLYIPFRPVATDLASTEAAVIAGASVGFGVRCSGALAPLFTAVTTHKGRYVDGTAAALVPTKQAVIAAASQWGGDIIVASNVVPSPRPEEPPQPRLPGRIPRLVFDFNPIRRFVDTFREGTILLHRTGNFEASASDIWFSAPTTFNDFPFWKMGKATEVMNEAGRALEEQQIIQRIEAAYKDGLTRNPPPP
ncbi:cyclic nucleotide-binding and patatin-like phospholipase domain-containing protein [Sorangium sp. So ce134]